jgi:type II secretory pathway pseudopilin PulG
VVAALRQTVHRRTRRQSRERGYNMVILVMVITLMNIALAVTLPAWSTAIRREKEEELIFRGLQYAEAIRVFRNRFQRLPMRLEELVEVKPRCIRQLWKDPMTESGKWQLLFEGQVTPPGGLQALPGTDAEEPEPGQLGGPQGPVNLGPIKGVRSSSSKEAILKFNNQQSYNQWEFTVDLLATNSAITQGAAVPGVPGSVGLALSSRWIGRPLPRGLVPLGINPNLPVGGGSGLPGTNPPQPPPGQPRPPGQGIHPPLIPLPGGGKPGVNPEKE